MNNFENRDTLRGFDVVNKALNKDYCADEIADLVEELHPEYDLDIGIGLIVTADGVLCMFDRRSSELIPVEPLHPELENIDILLCERAPISFPPVELPDEEAGR